MIEQIGAFAGQRVAPLAERGGYRLGRLFGDLRGDRRGAAGQQFRRVRRVRVGALARLDDGEQPVERNRGLLVRHDRYPAVSLTGRTATPAAAMCSLVSAIECSPK